LPSFRGCKLNVAKHLRSLMIVALFSITISAHAVIIDFEDIETTGWGTGGQTVISDQYQDRGVTFNSPVAIDYSKGLSIRGYAHSPTRAVEPCYSKEFCQTPVEMSFEIPVNYLKLWVGQSQSLSTPMKVRLQTYDEDGNRLGYDEMTMGPSDSPIPISIPLEVTSAEKPIYRADVGYMPDENGYVDNAGLAVDDVEFEVNEIPQVDLIASPDTSLNVGKTFIFSARATDPEGKPLEYSFTLDDHAVRRTSNNNTWEWKPTQEDVGDHVVMVRVSDGFQSSYDELQISVLPYVRPNALPSISSIQIAPETPRIESPATFTVRASDPEEEPLDFAFRIDQKLVRDWSQENILSWTPSQEDEGNHILEAMVRDNQHGGDFNSTTMPFTVGPNNDPNIADIQIAPEELHIGLPITFTAQASDPDADPLEYLFLLDDQPVTSWSASPNWEWTPLEKDAGEHTISLAIRDGKGRNPWAVDGEKYKKFSVPLPPPPLSTSSPLDWIPWILAGGLGTIILGSRIWRKVKARRKVKVPEAPNTSFKARSDRGNARVDPVEGLGVLAEISFRAVADAGVMQADDHGLDVTKEELER